MLEKSWGLLQQHTARVCSPAWERPGLFFSPMSLKWLNTNDSCSTEAERLDFSFCTLSIKAEGKRKKESPQLADNSIVFSASQMWKATGVTYVALWEGWSPYGRVLVASACGKVRPQRCSCEEGNLCPLLSCLQPPLLKALIRLVRSKVSPLPCPHTLLFGW